MFNFFTFNRMQRFVERKKRFEGDVEVLKTKQKVEYENVVRSFKAKKSQLENNIAVEIKALITQIDNLKKMKGTQTTALDEEMKVELKKVDNKFNQQILAKQNEIKKLNNLIYKEEQDIKDLIAVQSPNAPKVLVESEASKTTKK